MTFLQPYSDSIWVFAVIDYAFVWKIWSWIFAPHMAVNWHEVFLFFFNQVNIQKECFMRSSCMSICLSVCLSVCFHDNSRTIKRRMMKLGTYTLQVKSNMEFEAGSRTWSLTRSNWSFSYCSFRGHVRLHGVHVPRTHYCGKLVYMC